ncbi:hypothetical protein SAMN05877962_103173 [Alloalcanivorax xenomutans]|nr:hypothetical protein SAMN05877962_103173 [Alloalcanivorax xenomutans]
MLARGWVMIVDPLTVALTGALALGVGGALHCAGMCGGIAAALSFSIPEERRRGSRLIAWQSLFGSGRLLSYAGLGAIAGGLGGQLASGPASGGWHWPALLSALLMVLLTAHFLGHSAPIRALERLGAGLWRRLSPLTRRLMPVDHPLKALALGGLWGFLPCGLLYSALVLAAGTGEWADGALVMGMFGATTLLPVGAAGVFGGQLSRLRRGPARYVAAAMTLALALVFLQHGLPGDVHAHHHP